MAHDTGAPDASAGDPDGGVTLRIPAILSAAAPVAVPATVRLDALVGHVPAFERPAAALPPANAPAAAIRTRLAERIVTLSPAKSMEAFRTIVKVKATAGPLASPAGEAPQHGDDLTRIRGIDAALARRLATVGVTSFGQIAVWEQGDVQTISQALDLGRTISRQNWIEQAALLAGRGKAPIASQATAAEADPPAPRPAAPALTPAPLAILPSQQLAPAIAVPVVGQVALPSATASAIPSAAAQAAAAVAAQIALPRVVSVDSPGDAKFHRATVYVATPFLVERSVPLAAPAAPAPVHVHLPPAIPVPIVAAAPRAANVRAVPAAAIALMPAVPPPPMVPVPEVPAVPPARATAAAAAAVAASLPPFEVPVPVVPQPELAESPSVWLADISPAVPTGADQPLLASRGSERAAPASEDDVLETQLHAAVSAAADDRAVAATLNLLEAFAPPPVADGPGFPGAYPWPPETRTDGSRPVGTSSGADGTQERAEIESDIAFTRWVPTTPLPWPRPAPRSAADHSALPEPLAAPLRAAAQAVATSAASVPEPADWTRPRDRWALPDPLVGGPAADPAPQVMPPALPEPVEPTMLDRLASLEAELTALAANDQPRAHVAAAQSVNGNGPAMMRSELSVAPPYVPHDRARTGFPAHPAAALPLSPGRSGLRAAPPESGPLLTERGFLTGGEAEVQIVPRGGEQLEISAVTRGPSLGTLEQRMRRARPAPEVDVETYAGYHGAISEASVEIVRRDTHTRAVVFSDRGEGADDGASRGRESAVRKFFKALKGDSN
jgi:predicted flap endonuclease-1-like 5' DNA nuclease